MFTCFVPFKEQNLCHITPKLTGKSFDDIQSNKTKKIIAAF